jgi:hypothetical protein
MLAAVAPFARAGLRVDLAASDRLARRIVFQSTDLSSPQAAEGCPHETLELLGDAPGGWRLRRCLVLDGDPALRAELEVAGGAPAQLCDALAQLAPADQALRGEGWVLAFRHALMVGGLPQLRGASGRAGPLALEITVPAVPGYPVELRLSSRASGPLGLPHDLLSVLGARFSPLDPGSGGGWRATMRLRGRGASRSGEALSMLAALMAHLARTMAEPPARFHVRHRAARWWASMRRGVPLAICLALMGASATVPWLDLHADSLLRMLIFMSPPLVLAFVFSLRELPRIELPPLPRPPDPGAWRPGEGQAR